jgi:REP element-mobilizing transposase RayT
MAWVLMPDHLHWLIQLGDRHSLSEVIRMFKGRSSLAINTVLERAGAIWQRGFYDHALRREEDVEDIARYIVANPVRAGLVRSVREYSLWDAKWL